METAGRTGKRGLSIEEVFVQLSQWKAHDGPGALPRVLLTPRSAKACLSEGVDPQDLKIRDIDAFWEPGLDPAVQRMRHEAYSALRHEKMKSVRTARRAIVKEEELGGSGTLGGIGGGGGSVSPTRSVGGRSMPTARSTSSDAKNLLEIERRRLEKMKLKQQKEIEGMMAYEMKLAKIAEEHERRAELERMRQEKREREKMLRKKQAEELRRAKELKKKMMEEQEEARRREVVAKQFAKEQALLAEQRRKEAILKREAREREEERKRKQAEFREKTQAILAAQQAEIQAKMAEMEEQEAIRQAAMEEKRRQRAKEAEEKRLLAERRIAEAQARDRELERQRKLAYATKQQRQAEKERLKEEERERQRAEAERMAILEAHKRRLLLEQTKKEEELRKESLMAKQAEADEILRKVEADKLREQALRRERRRLIQEAKADKVERQRRRDEFYRMETLKALEDKAARTEAMLTEKEKMLQQRKELQLQVKKQRAAIMVAMEKAKQKKDFKNAEKTITMALNASTESKPRRKGRTTRSLPEIRSASGGDSEWDEQAARRAAKHYSDKAARLEAENARRRRERPADDDGPASGPGAYRSPYELVAMEKKTATVKTTPVPAFAHVASGAL